MSKDWADWDAGVEFIRKELGCSEGKARKIMDDAAKSGEVQVKKGYVPHEGLVGPVRSGPRGLTYLRNKQAETEEYEAFEISDFKYWFRENRENYATKSKPKRKGGRPPTVDRPVLLKAFQQEVEKRGPPIQANADKGWRTQGHVENWIIKFFNDDIGEATARRHARWLIEKIPAK